MSLFLKEVVGGEAECVARCRKNVDRSSFETRLLPITAINNLLHVVFEISLFEESLLDRKEQAIVYQSGRCCLGGWEALPPRVELTHFQPGSPDIPSS